MYNTELFSSQGEVLNFLNDMERLGYDMNKDIISLVKENNSFYRIFYRSHQGLEMPSKYSK